MTLERFTPELTRKMFPPATPKANVERYLPFVLRALEEFGLTETPLVLAALATIRAESESFAPIDEGVSQFNTSPGARPFNRYDNRADLGNTGPPDGRQFKGRGFIQLTGRANYAKHGADIGVDLIAHPERANEPETAARLLASFIAAKKGAMLKALAENDLKAARRLVNGGSHGLDRFTAAYRIGSKLFKSSEISEL